jgi:hypothetical protein
MNQGFRVQVSGDLPLVAAAIHNGHRVREEIARVLALDEANRLREEDPFTGEWTELAGTHIVVLRSRFQVDVNRPRDKAVYLKPENAWGLQVWKTGPSANIIARSLAEYDAFYTEVKRIFLDRQRRFGRFVVLDLHSYNHRREGPEGPAADPETHPEVNVGTGTMNRQQWAPVVERFIADLRGFDFLGRHLDVRENIKFRGGQFPRWIHNTFPESACCLTLEFKKFFMDEWTGKPDRTQIEAIRRALQSTVPGITQELRAYDGIQIRTSQERKKGEGPM